MRKMFTIIAFSISSFCYGQTYSYSFEGEIAESSLSRMEEKCSSIEGVSKTKIKYKPDGKKGEFIIVLKEIPNRGEKDEHPFAATKVKSLMLESGLSPVSFRLIKN